MFHVKHLVIRKAHGFYLPYCQQAYIIEERMKNFGGAVMYIPKLHKVWLCQSSEGSIHLTPKMANRHGLIAGATGTGKTVTLKVLAESFSEMGVPVFLADIKGDVSGMCLPGEDSEGFQKRIRNKLGLEIDWKFEGYPIRFWDVYGKKGHPVRTTISEIGPELLSRLLELNDTQTGIMNIIFRVADEQGLLLLDLKDLRSMVQYVGENAAALKTKYGNVSAQSVGAIQRALLRLEDQGGNIFFGEPALEIKDWFAQDEKGYGVINMLHCTELFQSPLLYSTFLLWMLSELYESMPEAGDLDKPKMVFFFDEAHLIFKDAPRSLLDKVEQIVRLIRSKGIGIYFITQLPSDIPDSVLSQLGNKLQHALRAYTPKDQKALKVAAQSFRPNPKLDAEAALSELGTGEVLVSLLDEEGIPGIVERAYVMPPRSFLGVAEESKRQEIIKASPLDSKYAKTVDRESAYEVLQKRAEQVAKEAAEEADEEYVSEDETIQEEIRRNSRSTSTKAKKTTTRRTTTKKEPPSMFEKVAEKAATSFGRSIANALARGILGSLLKK